MYVRLRKSYQGIENLKGHVCKCEVWLSYLPAVYKTCIFLVGDLSDWMAKTWNVVIYVNMSTKVHTYSVGVGSESG